MPHLITALREFTSGAINLVFPRLCVHCGRKDALLCQICIDESTQVGRDVCRICAKPLDKAGTCGGCLSETAFLDRLYGSYLYETPVGSAVKAFKFDDIRALGEPLAQLFDVNAMSRSKIDFIAPIPMHKSRVRSRGYNQSEILARKLAQKMDIDFSDELLGRIRPTPPQSVQPTAQARRSALSGAFELNSDSTGRISGMRILLVDDVFTTGSTVEAAAAILKTAGAKWVGAAALTIQPVGSLK